MNPGIQPQRTTAGGITAALALLALADPTAAQQPPPYLGLGWFSPALFPVAPGLADSSRAPLTDLPVREFGGRSLVPASVRREGFTPRIGLGVEYNDNVLFTPSDRKGDFVTVATPGANFRRSNARSYFEADYSFEATAYANQTQLNRAAEAQTGFLYWNATPTPTTRLIVVDNFQIFEDPTGQLVPGVRSGRTTTKQNYFDAQGLVSLSPTLDLRARIGSIVQRFDDAGATDNDQTDLEAGFLSMTGSRNRVGFKYRHRDVSFSGAPGASTSTFAGEDEFRLSPTVTVRAVAGMAEISGAAATQRPVLGAQLVATTQDVHFGLSFDQDVRATGGLPTLFFGRSLTAGARWHVTSRWYVAGGLSVSRFESLGTDGIEVNVIEPRLTVSWALQPGLVVAARYSYARQAPNFGAPVSEVNRINITLAYSF